MGERKVFQKSYSVATFGNRTTEFRLSQLAISIQDADISYGYILFNYKDLSPTDSSLQKAIASVWDVLCGNDVGLTGEKRII